MRCSRRRHIVSLAIRVLDQINTLCPLICPCPYTSAYSLQKPFHKVGIAARRGGDEATDDEHHECLEETVLRRVKEAFSEPLPHRRK